MALPKAIRKSRVGVMRSYEQLAAIDEGMAVNLDGGVPTL